MPRISADDVRGLAELARLSLTRDECDAFTRELERILEYAERILAVDTEGVEPASGALLGAAPDSGERPLREDEPRSGIPRETALDAAPDDGEGLFKVPKVLP